MTSPVSAAHPDRRGGLPQVILILGLTAAAVTLVLAKVPVQTVLLIISGTTFTGAVGYRVLTGGPLPRYVRASPAPQRIAPEQTRADVIQLVRPAEGGGDATS